VATATSRSRRWSGSRSAPDGTLSAPTAAGNLVAPRAGQAVAVIGDTVYVIGGQDATAAFLTSIESAPILADGTLGAFTMAGNLKDRPR